MTQQKEEETWQMTKTKKRKKGKELSLNSLKKVTGGSGLKKVKFEETHDITEDIKKRM